MGGEMTTRTDTVVRGSVKEIVANIGHINENCLCDFGHMSRTAVDGRFHLYRYG